MYNARVSSVKRKGIVQALRYIAHSYGATLMFTSLKDKSLGIQVSKKNLSYFRNCSFHMKF